MYKHKLTTLKNGLRLITIPMPQVESVTVMVGVGAGSRYENKRVNGLFHFIEHMAFKGTKKRPSTLQIGTEIDGIGGFFNAYTSREFTGYHIKAAAKHIELLFDVLADIITNSLYKPEEIEREKGVIIEEINMIEDTPQNKIWRNFVRTIYGDNPMGWFVAGEKETVKKIVRQDFIDYLEKLYVPQNMVVAVAGKFDKGKLLRLTKRFLGRLKKKKFPEPKRILLDQKKANLNLSYKKTEQAHFLIGVPGFNYKDKNRFAAWVLRAILGGGMSSRLFIEIRERRGLAYYTRSADQNYTDSGWLATGAGVKLKAIEEAIKVTLDQYYDLVAKKPTLKELKKAKEFIKGRFILTLEDSWEVANRYACLVILEKKIRTPEETIALIDKVTPEDIQRVAKEIFQPKNLNLAIIGPYKNEARFKKLLEG